MLRHLEVETGASQRTLQPRLLRTPLLYDQTPRSAKIIKCVDLQGVLELFCELTLESNSAKSSVMSDFWLLR